MSGFDLPPIRGFDQSFQQPVKPFVSPEVQGPARVDGPTEAAPDRADTPFAGVLADSLNEVRGLQLDAKDKVRGMVMGEDVELHDVMIASSKSEVAFNLLLEVRNKMVDAWEKLSRSSV